MIPICIPATNKVHCIFLTYFIAVLQFFLWQNSRVTLDIQSYITVQMANV